MSVCTRIICGIGLLLLGYIAGITLGHDPLFMSRQNVVVTVVFYGAFALFFATLRSAIKSRLKGILMTASVAAMALAYFVFGTEVTFLTLFMVGCGLGLLSMLMFEDKIVQSSGAYN